MLRKCAKFVADLVGGNLLIGTLLTAICALLGLAHVHDFQYFVPVGLALGAATIFSLIYENGDWKLTCFLGVAFALIGLAYSYSSVYPNLHADTAWFFLGGAAFLATPAWISLQLDGDPPDDRAAYAGSTVSLLVLLAPLIWGAGALVLVLVLLWLAFAGWWLQTQLSSLHGNVITMNTFFWGLLPLLAVVVTYEIGNKWAAAIVPLVAFLISADQVGEKLNPRPEGYRALA